MSKNAISTVSFSTKSEKYTNEVVLENFGLLRRMYANHLSTETYQRWNWSWSYVIQPSNEQSRFRIVVQFNDFPLTPGHLLAFKAILSKKNTSLTRSSECICLKEETWLTNNSNVLDLCSTEELEEFIFKDTLKLIIIVRHDWLVKKKCFDEEILDSSKTFSPTLNPCAEKFLRDIKSIGTQLDSADVTIRVHQRSYRCHRSILAARSTYFQTLFYSTLNNETLNEIDLTSFLSNENDFDLLHLYLYKGETLLSEENIFQYIRLSDQFLLDDLYKSCQMFLLTDNHINKKNVWQILDIFYTLERKRSKEIQEKCFHLIKNHSDLINDQCQDIFKRHPQLCLELVKYFV